jgi:hypothetical protein
VHETVKKQLVAFKKASLKTPGIKEEEFEESEIYNSEIDDKEGQDTTQKYNMSPSAPNFKISFS